MRNRLHFTKEAIMRRKPVVKLLRSIVKLRAILRTSKTDLARRLKSHVGRRPPAPRDEHFCSEAATS